MFQDLPKKQVFELTPGITEIMFNPDASRQRLTGNCFFQERVGGYRKILQLFPVFPDSVSRTSASDPL
jgi:hypothetical protein